MLKFAALGLFLVIAVSQYSKFSEVTKVPELPSDEWWGPGKSHKVDEGIRPFKIDVPKEIIDDLKVRLNGTRSLRQPLEGAGWTYGIGSDYLHTILEHWRTKYDWTKRQTLLNKYPQFKTNIQGLDIHFYHVKPTVPKDGSIRVLPLLLVHGWPGSIVEFQKIIPLLTTPDPARDFVFEVIAPSLPGYGFSDAAIRPGLGAGQISVIFKNLMKRLGFETFYAQGGDWGSGVTSILALLYPKSVLGLHVNFCVADSPTNTAWSIVGAYIPSLVISNEHWSRMYPLSHHWSRLVEESGYLHLQATKPDTVGTSLSDSPAGLAAYILEKFSTWTNPDYRFRKDGGLLEKFSVDELLDNVMIYWVTNSITTSMRLYSEELSHANRDLKLTILPIHTPSACAIFPHELAYQPESMVRSKYTNLVQFNHLPRGGHFAAFEEPRLLADDLFGFISLLEGRRKSAESSGKNKL